MWKCKHCNNEFKFNTTSEKANHSRWCDNNPKRNDSCKVIAESQRKRHAKRLGNYRDFNVVCNSCGDDFVVSEREKMHPIKEKYYCTRNCANAVGGQAKADKYGYSSYKTICFKHHEYKCIICGEDKLVTVHHYDCDHNNNNPTNLVPLCATHHQYMHSRYKSLIVDQVDSYIRKKNHGEWDC